MSQAEAMKVLEEAQKRLNQQRSVDASLLFGPQREFVNDASKSKIAVCSRRAGKSFGVAHMLLNAGLKHERSIVPYITLTRDTGKDILWPALRSIGDACNLPLRYRENTGDVVLPNKSKIIIRGAEDRRQIEKLRGPAYPIAIVDEAQGFPYFLHDLIEDVLEPATPDYNGQIVLTGTPNAACAGPFYDMCERMPGWSVHKWTLRDNPHLPAVEEWLKRKREQKGWNTNNPTYLREYCGVWIRDATGLVYKMEEAHNVVPSFVDHGDTEYVLGVDLGFDDPTAFVVLAYSRMSGKATVLESYKQSGLIPSAVAARIERLMRKYPLTRVVVDAGGLGKGYVEEMKRTFSLPVVAADKSNKVGYIAMLNGDLMSGRLEIVGSGNPELIDEMRILQWDLDKMSKNHWVVDDKRFADHLCDAMLYGWRACRHYEDEWQHAAPKAGSLEAIQAEADRMEAEDVARLEGNGDPWWLQ